MATLEADDNLQNDILDDVALANRGFFQEYFMDSGSEDDNENDFEGFVELNDERDDCTEVTDIPNDSTNIANDISNITNRSSNDDEIEINNASRPTASTTNSRSSRQANILPEKLHESHWNEGPLTPKSIPFASLSKINVDTTAFDVVKFYELFFDKHITDKLVLETNIYANQLKSARTLSPHARLNKWVNTNSEEMKTFLGLVIAMGLVQQLTIGDYWSHDEVVSTPFFPAIMPRNRFLAIMSCLHLNNNSNQLPRDDANYDPIFKLRPVYDHLKSKFLATFTPGENLALDEATIAWRGNLSFRVYNPDKPTRFGIKMYEICDSNNGYCSNFEMYMGKNRSISSKGATYDLVMRLMAPYLNKGYKLYTDNYYSSPILFSDLLEKKTGACGTLRTNRKGVPQKIREKSSLNKGETICMNNGELQIIKWHDNRDVNMISSIHSTSMAQTGKNDRQTGEAIQKPLAVIDYNKNMGGVDRSDQMLQYQAFRRRTMKWWKKAFFHLLDLAVLNSYILYKLNVRGGTAKVFTQREFRRKLVHSLTSHTTSPSRRLHATGNEENMRRLSERHFPTHIPQTTKKEYPTRRCVVCCSSLKRGHAATRKESRYQCVPCNVGLCVDPCFEIYHTCKEYKLAFQRRHK